MKISLQLVTNGSWRRDRKKFLGRIEIQIWHIIQIITSGVGTVQRGG